MSLKTVVVDVETLEAVQSRMTQYVTSDTEPRWGVIMLTDGCRHLPVTVWAYSGTHAVKEERRVIGNWAEGRFAWVVTIEKGQS